MNHEQEFEDQVLEEYKDELHKLKALINLPNMSTDALESIANVLLARMIDRKEELIRIQRGN